MMGVYSRNLNGFISLFPYREHGEDVAVAMYQIGIRSSAPRSCPISYAMLIPTENRAVLLTTQDLKTARRIAAKNALISPVILLRSVAMGSKILYQRIERLEAMTPSAASKVENAYIVAPGGMLLEKALNPNNPKDFLTIVKSLVGQLQTIDKQNLKPLVEDISKEANDMNWAKMNYERRSAWFARKRKLLQNNVTADLMPMWAEEIRISATFTMNGVKRDIKRRFLPKIGASLTREETEATQIIGEQQGWFIRDKHKQISADLTERGRKIVQDGIDKGLSSRDIGKMLRDKLPDMWDAQSKNYSQVVARNALGRSRNYSSANSYREADVEKLEVVAMLDERTTDVCRFMDGKIIDVGESLSLAERAMKLQNPEDIYKTTPFMRTIEDEETGKTYIETMTGTRVAEVLESGIGGVDDRGKTRQILSPKNMPSKGIGLPPYHHNCRTITVPVIAMWFAPRNYARSVHPVKKAIQIVV